jgi:VanZ family protein
MKNYYSLSLRYRWVYLILSIGIGIGLLVVSLLPYAYIEESFYPQVSDLFDMMNHFLGFLLFDFLLFSAILGKTDAASARRRVSVYFAIAVFWGLLCEGTQAVNVHRKFQIHDVLANTLPALVVYLSLPKILLPHTD